MPSFIPPDFKPREDDYHAPGISHIPRDFLDVVVTPEFMEYWTELKERKLKKGRKDAWFTTWRNRARYLWKLRGPAWEENRHKRDKFNGQPRNDLFEQAKDYVENNGCERATVQAAQAHRQARLSDVAVRPRLAGDNRAELRPAAAAPMTPEQAFAELRKQGVI